MNRQVTSLPVTEKSVANGNWDTSRVPIDRIIIHTMVGYAAAADARFNNSTSQVSAHYGVLLDGSIWHWVDEDNTAYHAGNYAMNQRSIGIEHEDGGDYNGVRPDVLYKTSAQLVRDICQFYNIPIDRNHILKHSEIIATGCPDALDIDRIVREAQGVPVDTCPFDRDMNWNVANTIAQAIPFSLNADNKLASAQDAANAITAIKRSLADCQANPPLPPTPPSVPSTPDVTDYKSYLLAIWRVMYGRNWFWVKMAKIRDILTQAGFGPGYQG